MIAKAPKRTGRELSPASPNARNARARHGIDLRRVQSARSSSSRSTFAVRRKLSVGRRVVDEVLRRHTLLERSLDAADRGLAKLLEINTYRDGQFVLRSERSHHLALHTSG